MLKGSKRQVYFSNLRPFKAIKVAFLHEGAKDPLARGPGGGASTPCS